jgi:hypothetical protein
MAKDDRQQTIDEFDEAVNVTRKELGDWPQTDESKSVGQGEGGSMGHESGRRIAKLPEKKHKSDHTNDELDHMKKVNRYSKRHLGQGPKNNVEDSKWRYSLINFPNATYRAA